MGIIVIIVIALYNQYLYRLTPPLLASDLIDKRFFFSLRCIL